jgi:hypothetical protein
MKTITYVIASLALMVGSAQAWEIRTTCSGSWYFGSVSCREVGIPNQAPVARDYAQEAEDLRVKQAGIKKWETYCKPVRTYDDLGVVRLSYARQGCEFGRNE